jgi:hypothetical protein
MGKFKPGQSGNPKGTSHPPELKRARRLNAHEFGVAATKMLNMTLEQLEEMNNDPKTIMMDKCIAVMLIEGHKKKSEQHFRFVYDRVLGKPKEMLTIKDERAPVKIDEASLKDRLLSQLTDEQLQALIDKPKQDIEEVEYKEVTDGNDSEPVEG